MKRRLTGDFEIAAQALTSPVPLSTKEDHSMSDVRIAVKATPAESFVQRAADALKAEGVNARTAMAVAGMAAEFTDGAGERDVVEIEYVTRREGDRTISSFNVSSRLMNLNS